MEVSFLIGFAFMWAAVFFARKVSVKEIQLLSTEKKAELIDMAAGRRGMQIAILAIGIAAFYAISYFIHEAREMWFGLYALFIVGWMFYQLQKALSEYRKRQFPESFVNAQRNAGLIRLLGILGFFIAIGLNFVFY